VAATGLAAAAMLWLRYYASLARLMFADLHMNDFGKLYYSARLALSGQDMYGPSPATLIPVSVDAARQLWNLNPPHAHLVILPLAGLDEGVALAIWAVVNLVGFGLSAQVILRELGVSWSPRLALAMTGLVVFSSATGAIIATGQMTGLLVLPVTLAWVAARRGGWITAALWLGLAASVKPLLAIFGVYFVLRRQVTPALVMVGVVAAAFALGLAVFGPDNLLAWGGALQSVDWHWAAMNGSLWGLVARTLAPSPYFTPLVTVPGLVGPLSWLAAVVVGTIGLARLVTTRPTTDVVFAGLLVTALATSPLGWIYHLPLAAGPLAALWLDWRIRRSRVRDLCLLLALPGLVCPLLLTVLRPGLAWYTVTVGSAYAWSTIGLWGAVMFDARPSVSRR